MNPFSEPRPQYNPKEIECFQKIFSSLDSGNGIITPSQTVSFLIKSKLDKSILSKIWELSDSDKKGFLNKNDFFCCLKLVSLAQNGFVVSKESLNIATPLPVFDDGSIGVNRTGSVLSAQPTGLSIQATGASLIITPEEKQRFKQFFEQSGPVDGFLTAQVAFDIFIKSQLPNDVLKEVWEVSDKDKTGKFGLSQFLIAMTIITRLKQGVLKAVPVSVPPSLWNSITSNAGVSSPLARVSTLSTTSPLPPSVPSLATSSSSTAKIPITDSEKQQYSGYFDTLDTTKKGFLKGDECFAFFIKSGLSREDLAKVWELASKDGKVDREGFVNAMGMIRLLMQGQPLPAKSSVDLLATKNTVMDRSVKATAEVNLLGDLESPVGNLAAPSVFGNQLKTPPITSSIPVGLGTKTPPLSSALPISTPGSNKDPFKDPVPLAAPISKPVFPSDSSSVFPTNGAFPDSFATSVFPAMPTPQQVPLASQTLQLEQQELGLREQALNLKKQELSQFQSQLMDLTPKAEEIKKKREAIEQEYRTISEKRNEVSLQVSQLRAQYEVEFQAVKDGQESLVRESRLLQAAQTELAQVQEALKIFVGEKDRLESEKKKQHDELMHVKKQVSELTEEANKMREQVDKVSSEIKQQQQYLDINVKLLESTKQEYQNVKRDLEMESSKLEQDRQRAMQLEQQASVQEAITRKERERIQQMEKERQKELSRSQALLASIESEKLELEQELKKASSGDQLQLPDGPAPPIPSPLTKPVKPDAELVQSGSSFSLNSMFLPPPTEPVNIPQPQLTSTPIISPSSVSTSPKGDLKAEKDDLDALLSTNRPKSPANELSSSPPKDFKASTGVNTPKMGGETPLSKLPVDFDSFFSKPLAEAKVAKVEAPIPVQEFKFDATFSGPEIPKSTSFGDFTDSFPAFPSPPKPDLDAAFGGAPKPSNNPTSNPFSNVDFEAAFNTPFRAPTTIPDFPAPMPLTTSEKTSSPQDSDTPEVKNIISMGFTREQALNALEIHSFDVNNAINYLLESTAK